MVDVVTPLMEALKEVLNSGFHLEVVGVEFGASLAALASLGLIYKFVWKPYVGVWLKEFWDDFVAKK